jgi:hypothetical protein
MILKGGKSIRFAVMIMKDEAFHSDEGNRCPEVAGGEAVAD